MCWRKVLTDLGEGGDLLVAVAVEVLLGVVDCHSAVDAIGQCGVLHDGHALVGSVGVFEVHGSSPVVAVLVRHCNEVVVVGVYLKSSENVQLVQVASPAGSVSMVALNALPPTI